MSSQTNIINIVPFWVCISHLQFTREKNDWHVLCRERCERSFTVLLVNCHDVTCRTYIRTGNRFVLISGILAIIIPQLDNFISLVGSICSSALAIIFPVAIHIITLTTEGDGRVPTLTFFKDAAIMLLGLLMFLFGTYTSVARIVVRYQTGHN